MTYADAAQNVKTKSPAVFGDTYKSRWEAGKMITPSDVRPEADDPKWYLQWAEFIYGRYCNNYTMFCPGGFAPSFNEARTIHELRLYGRGQQPVQKYQSMIDVSRIKGPDGQRLGLVNISWDTHRVYRAFREIIIDRLMGVEHEPGIVAIDTPSLRKKQLAYASDRLASSAQSKAMFQQIGMTPDGVNENIMDMKPADVDIMNQLGGYATAVEIAMKEATQASLQFSNWDPEIKRQTAEDLVDIGVCATHTKYDHASGRQMIEYVDLNGLIIPSSQYDDCRDIDYAGIVRKKTISQLRQCSDLTEAQLWGIAKQYSGIGVNSRFGAGFSQYQFTERSAYAARFNGICPYDQFECQTMTLYFTAMDVERYIVGYRPEGNMIYDKVSRESQLGPKDEKRGRMVHDNIIQYVYRCEWIIGTQIVFNYGVDDVVRREGEVGAKKAVLPVAVYRCNGGSITGACIAAIDDLQLCIYKKRHAMTVMPPPPNMAIDMAIMEDSARLNGMDLSPLDLQDIYTVLGIFYYHSKPEFAGVGEGGSNKSPLTPMGDNTERYMLMLQNELMNSINNLRMISGVNELADGSGDAKDVLNKVAAGFEQASNRSISMLYTASTGHYKKMCSLIVRGYQSVAAYGGKNIYYLPVSSEVVQMIQLYPEYALNELDISIQPGIDANSRQMLIQALIQNRDMQKIEDDTYLMVLNLIQTGRVQRAQYVMAKGVKDKTERDQQQQIQLMQQQSAAQAEQATITEDAKRKTLAMEGEVKGKQIQLQGDEARKTEKDKHDYRMAELELEMELSTSGVENQPV